MPSVKSRKSITQYETMYGGSFNADAFLQSNGNIPLQSGGQLNITTTGLLTDMSVETLQAKIQEYAAADLQIVSDVLGPPTEDDINTILNNDLIFSQGITGSNYNNAINTINALLTTKSNVIQLRDTVILPKRDADNSTPQVAASNLTSLWAASNALITTTNLSKYEQRKGLYETLKTNLMTERQQVASELQQKAQLIESRKSAAIARINTLDPRIKSDKQQLDAMPQSSRGPNFETILSTFQQSIDALPPIYDRISPIQAVSIDSSTQSLKDLRDVRNTLNSNMNIIETAEYDLSGINIATRSVIQNIQQAQVSVGTSSLKRNLGDASVKEVIDASGTFYNILNTTKAEVDTRINSILESYSQLSSEQITTIGNLINTIYQTVYQFELKQNELNQQFNYSDTNVPMMLYDDDAAFEQRKASIQLTVQNQSNFQGEIEASLQQLITLFTTSSNALRKELLDKINTHEQTFSGNYNYIVSAVPVITTNMSNAYVIMNSSNYKGKYSYFYDYINAMLGFSNTITAQAPNGPDDAPDIDPASGGAYDFSNLYYDDGRIKLMKKMYKYIDGRYTGIPSSYSQFKNDYDAIYSESANPEKNLNDLRNIYSNLLMKGVNREIDAAQIRNYSNRIFNDPIDSSNLSSEQALRNYIGERQRIAGNPVEEKAAAVQQVNTLWNQIQSNVTEIKQRIEQLRDSTEEDLAFISEYDFNGIATFRAQLLDNYAQAEFIYKQDSQYFMSNYSKDGVTGTFLDIYSAPVISALGAELQKDMTTLNGIKSGAAYTNLEDTYRVSISTTRSQMLSTFSNIANDTTGNLSSANEKFTYVTSLIQTDLPRLQEKKLNSACFEFYPILVSASNDVSTKMSGMGALRQNFESLLSSVSEASSLGAIDDATQSLLTASNDIYNLYLVGSNYSNILTGKTDELLAAYNNVYNGIDKSVVDALPLFTGQNCSTDDSGASFQATNIATSPQGGEAVGSNIAPKEIQTIPTSKENVSTK